VKFKATEAAARQQQLHFSYQYKHCHGRYA
jgi:hypothetical protein